VASLARPALSAFARDVAEGLTARVKKLSPQYFYDDLGSALFDAITLLPEYGLTSADERILTRHSPHLAARVGPVTAVCELGSGSGRKTRPILEALDHGIVYQPVDVSAAALAACEKALADIAIVRPVCADWIDGLHRIGLHRAPGPLVVLFLGSSIGNLDRSGISHFLAQVRFTLRPGDFFLVGFDLVKDVERMLAAYDDPTGVTAAFNLNLLGRINRELDGEFELRAFSHEARWNQSERRIEMHLVSARAQHVYIGALECAFSFAAGETIWTESSHKFIESELPAMAAESGFTSIASWIDPEWPFAEVLWQAV
jgi:dimethylhistidine N-methyltransferase